MATITAGDFRNGKTFEMDGKIMQVVEFQHVKPGKGAAFVRTKMKNIVTGAVTETSFNPTAKFEEAFVERKDMAYSYNDGDLYYFMDQETFDMVPLGKDLLGDAFRFITENTVCKVLSYKGNVFGLECPNFMDLEVTETEPGRQHRHQHPQARHRGDRRRGEGAPVYQHWRQDYHRHPHRRVSGPRQVRTAVFPPPPISGKEHEHGNF